MIPRTTVPNLRIAMPNPRRLAVGGLDLTEADIHPIQSESGNRLWM